MHLFLKRKIERFYWNIEKDQQFVHRAKNEYKVVSRTGEMQEKEENRLEVFGLLRRVTEDYRYA